MDNQTIIAILILLILMIVIMLVCCVVLFADDLMESRVMEESKTKHGPVFYNLAHMDEI
jgi:hypothetical protein